jgi:hypothetical protein
MIKVTVDVSRIVQAVGSWENWSGIRISKAEKKQVAQLLVQELISAEGDKLNGGSSALNAYARRRIVGADNLAWKTGELDERLTKALRAKGK